MIAIILATMITASDAVKITDHLEIDSRKAWLARILKNVEEEARKGSHSVLLDTGPDCDHIPVWLQAKLKKLGYGFRSERFTQCGVSGDLTGCAERSLDQCTLTWSKK